MRKTGIFLVILALAFVCAASAENAPTIGAETRHSHPFDLYRVYIQSAGDADVISGIGVDALLHVRGGYLILIDPSKVDLLRESGVVHELVATDVDRRRLVLDIRADGANAVRYPIVWQEDELRLFRVDPDRISDKRETRGLAPIPSRNLEIIYREPSIIGSGMKSAALAVDLDSLVSLVSQDSLEAYSYLLQTMSSRVAGSSTGKRCQNWLVDKFAEYGYDSIVVDTFTEPVWWGDPVTGYNVLAYKVGNLYSYDDIIVGAHRDTEPGSPGADDNGSGVAAVMEIARILRDVETNMTIIFALFDAEEDGLLGATHYAAEAAEREDRIAFMLNMDMIGFYYNSTDAKLYSGWDSTYAVIWSRLADSVSGINIVGHLCGQSGLSDHAPFDGYGYDVVFANEGIFSNVYHSPRDSTTYLNFDYMTRMTMASLATTYYVDEIYVPSPTLIILPVSECPSIIYPGSPAVITVQVLEYAGGLIEPGSVRLTCSLNGGAKMILPMTDLGGGIFEAELPAMACGDRLTYRVTATELNSESFVSYPRSSSLRACKATAVKVIFEDDFEEDLGWSSGGTATSGFWERYRASGNASEPVLDYDGSGKCFLTDHGFATDVDGGRAVLKSPEIDISKGEVVFEYARWFANDLGANARQDVFEVYIHNGPQLYLLETVGPVDQASGDWYFRRYWLSDVLVPADSIRLRFDATDLGYDSEVEAAVDAVRFIMYLTAPDIITETFPDGTVGMAYSQQLAAMACEDPIAWSDKYGDLDGTGLTLSPDGLVSGMVSDTGVIMFTAEATDAVGVANDRQYTLHFWLPFVCGDANRDGNLNVSDPVFVINYIFKDGPAPYPPEVADANGDGGVEIGDAVSLISYIFKGGDPPICQ